jgi:hypothetical protein
VRDVRPFISKLKGKTKLVGAEIGVESGLNAKIMFEELDIQTLYLIDPYVTYNNMSGSGVMSSDRDGSLCREHAHKILEEYRTQIVWIEDMSSVAEKYFDNDYLDFVYIDGNHRYEFVKKDIELYLSKVKISGLLAGHDYKSGEPGVIKAVKELLSDNKTLEIKEWDWMIIK